MSSNMNFELDYTNKDKDDDKSISCPFYSVKLNKAILSTLQNSSTCDNLPTIEFINSERAILRCHGKEYVFHLSDLVLTEVLSKVNDDHNDNDSSSSSSSSNNNQLIMNRLRWKYRGDIIRRLTVTSSTSKSSATLSSFKKDPMISIPSVSMTDSKVSRIDVNDLVSKDSNKQEFTPSPISKSTLSFKKRKLETVTNIIHTTPKQSKYSVWAVIHSVPTSFSFHHVMTFLSDIHVSSIYGAVDNSSNSSSSSSSSSNSDTSNDDDIFTSTDSYTCYIEFQNSIATELALLRDGETIKWKESTNSTERMIHIEEVKSSIDALWAKSTGFKLSHHIPTITNAVNITKKFIHEKFIDVKNIFNKSLLEKARHPITYDMIESSNEFNSALDKLFHSNYRSDRKTLFLRDMIGYNNSYDIVSLNLIKQVNYNDNVDMNNDIDINNVNNTSYDTRTVRQTISRIEGILFELNFRLDVENKDEKTYVMERLERILCLCKIVVRMSNMF